MGLNFLRKNETAKTSWYLWQESENTTAPGSFEREGGSITTGKDTKILPSQTPRRQISVGAMEGQLFIGGF